MEQKCVKCGEIFPFTEEFFYKQLGARDGLRKRCKECHKACTIEYEQREEVIKHIKSKNKTVDYDNIKIIKARKKRGLTKLEVAARLFIKYRTYEAIEGTEHKRINKKISKVNYKKIYDFFELEQE